MANDFATLKPRHLSTQWQTGYKRWRTRLIPADWAMWNARH